MCHDMQWLGQISIRNVWTSSDEGKLADLLKELPFLEISGSYEDEYGGGEIERCAQC